MPEDKRTRDHEDDDRRREDDSIEAVRFFAGLAVAVLAGALFWIAVAAIVYLLVIR